MRITRALIIPFIAALLLAFAGQAGAVTRTYPIHTRIVATTAWVGEVFEANAADGSQVCSTYDDKWAFHWSGIDNGARAGAGTDCAGAPLGGCDGRPSGTGINFKCATERRTAANGYFPTSPLVHPRENPFYLDLPYDDINNARAFADRTTVVPWANDPGYAGHKTDHTFSYMKNRWVKLTRNGRTCYAQNEDAGPAKYHDVQYVFGSNDARPASRQFGGAGMDVSPAVTGCLGFADIDGITGGITWQFVEANQVPVGPWRTVVTYSQVNGKASDATYRASITPSG